MKDATKGSLSISAKGDKRREVEVQRIREENLEEIFGKPQAHNLLIKS